MSAIPQDFHEREPVIVALRVHPIVSGAGANGAGDFIAAFQIRNVPGLITVSRENMPMVKSVLAARGCAALSAWVNNPLSLTNTSV